MHLSNIYQEGELVENPTTKDFLENNGVTSCINTR